MEEVGAGVARQQLRVEELEVVGQALEAEEGRVAGDGRELAGARPVGEEVEVEDDLFGVGARGRRVMAGLFEQRGAGYAAFGATITKNFSDVLGIHDPRAFLDSIQDGNGYKWNSVDKGYLSSVKNGVLMGFGLNFFDDCLLSLLRAGQDVKFNGVTVSSIDELNRLLNSTHAWEQKGVGTFLSGVYQGWQGYVGNPGTEKDNDVRSIRRAFTRAGSHHAAEEEAVYEYRLSLTR